MKKEISYQKNYKSEYKTEYIFPKNYNVKPKFLGIFEYNFVFILSVFILIVYWLLNIFNLNILLKIEIMIIIFLPIILIVASTVNEESLIYKIKYYISYKFSNKIYLYQK